MIERSYFVSFTLLACVGCAAPDDSSRAGSSSEAAHSAPVVRVPVTPTDSLADSAGLGGLLSMLQALPGEFSRAPSGMLSFSGDARVLPSFHWFADSAVAQLVACLDDTTAAAATYRGLPVRRGALCGLALQRTAYSRAHEDGAGDWAGIVGPDASAEQLRAAKREWQAVVAAKGYALP